MTVVGVTMEEKFWARVDRSGECWEWTGGYRDGRPTFYVGKRDGRSSYVPAAHISLELIGEDRGNRQVSHLCDNVRCVRPDHLAHALSDRSYQSKKCRTCREIKPSSDFMPRPGNTDNLHSYCTPCLVVYRRGQLLAKYGIDIETYERMVEDQRGGCAACGATGKQLHVDHDHATGRVRALLCGGCNVALGQCHEDPERLRSLALYAERMIKCPKS